MHGDYSSIANWQTESTFGIFRGISKFLFIYYTTFCGTPDDVLRNRVWVTLG